MRSDNHNTGGDRTATGVPGESAAPGHVLLTVLGREPQPARYCLEDREVESRLAPLALYDLLPQSDRPDRIVALCTPEAERESWPLLETALNGRCRTDLVRVDAQAGIDDYIVRAAEAFYDKADITVDVTHGFRHLSFLTYMVVLYVSELHGARVRGAWYGLLRRNESSPFLDLRPLLELPRWLYGIRALNDMGSARPIADILGDNSAKPTAKKLADDLIQVSEAYLSGLPLELSRQAGIVREQRLKSLRKLISEHYRLPLSDSLVDLIKRFLSPFESGCASASGNGWKGKTPLTEQELKTQAQHIDHLLERGHVGTALGLLSEWTVSWVLWVQGKTQEWLDYGKGRRGAANLLGAIEAVGNDKRLGGCLSGEQRRLGSYWRNLRDLRNGYAHHGMRRQVLVGDKGIENTLRHIRQYWKETLRCCPTMCLSLGEQPGCRVLVSPIGRSSGVLYSALHACKEEAGEEPALLLPICSRETENDIQAAASAAGYTGSIQPILLTNPYGGVSEIEPQAGEARSHFVGAGEVFVNVTGGTTLMGLVAEALANAARRLACPVRRFGLIENRQGPKGQDAEPWQVGEPFWIDGRKDGDADDP